MIVKEASIDACTDGDDGDADGDKYIMVNAMEINAMMNAMMAN